MLNYACIVSHSRMTAKITIESVERQFALLGDEPYH